MPEGTAGSHSPVQEDCLAACHSGDIADQGPSSPAAHVSVMIPAGGRDEWGEYDASGRRRGQSPGYTTERPWNDSVPVAAAARGREVELQEKRTVPKAKQEIGGPDDEIHEESTLLDQNDAGEGADGGSLPAMHSIPRTFRASWPSTYERVMHMVRPATDIYFILALFFVTFFSPPPDAGHGAWVVWFTLKSHKFLLIWLPFWWRFFRSFLHLIISFAIIPGPVLYHEGPLLKYYPKWLLETIKEGNAYRHLLRPRLEKAGGITLQVLSADGVAVDALYFRGDNNTPDGPTVIRFNGNAEAIELQDEILPKIYTQNGLNLILFNYRGVGRSRWQRVLDNDLAGTLLGLWRTPTINGTHIDAWSLLEYVTKELRVPPNKVVLLGHSIGGAIATELAAKKPAMPVCLCNSRSFGYLRSARPQHLELDRGSRT
jgi:hypothetical protein